MGPLALSDMNNVCTFIRLVTFLCNIYVFLSTL